MADMTRDQIVKALRAAHEAGDFEAGQRFADMLIKMRQQDGTIPSAAAPEQAAEPAPQVQPQVEAQKDGYSIVSTDRGRFLVNPQGQWSPVDEGGTLSRALEQTDDFGQARDMAARADRLAADPMARAAGFAGNVVKGVPVVGSWVDDAFGAATNLAGGDGEAVAQQARDTQDAFALAFPKTSIGANLGGSALTLPYAVAAAPKVVGGGSNLMKILRGATLGGGAGAVEGAIYGAGEGEEGSRADTAKLGALYGAAFGGGLGAAVPMLGGLGRTLYNAMSGRRAREASRMLGMRQDVAGLLADRVAADAPYAAQNIAQAGESATLGNLGPSTRSLLDAVANSPGRSAAIARQNVEGIVEGASERFVQTLDDVLGAPQGQNFLQRSVMQQSSIERNNAYNAAYRAIIDYAKPEGVSLRRLLARVDGSVLRRAERLMRAEGISSKQIEAAIDDATGNVTFTSLPDVRQIDYITRALRDSGGFGGGLGPDEARVVKKLSSEIRQTLDKLVPEYGVARSIAADAISEREAVNVGRNMLKPSVTREDLSLEISGMTPAELSMVRQGLRSQIDDAMANVRRGLTRTDSEPQSVLKPLRDLTAPAAREKIGAILEPQEAERLFAMLDEAEQAFSMRIVAGSRTAPRSQEDAAIRELIPGGLTDELIDKGFLGTVSSAAGKAARAGAQTQEQAMDEIRTYLAQAMTQAGNVPRQAAMLNNFADLGRRMQLGATAAENTGQRLGVAAGLPLSIGASRPESQEQAALLRRLAEAGYDATQIVEIMQGGSAAIEQALSR